MVHTSILWEKQWLIGHNRTTNVYNRRALSKFNGLHWEHDTEAKPPWAIMLPTSTCSNHGFNAFGAFHSCNSATAVCKTLLPCLSWVPPFLCLVEHAHTVQYHPGRLGKHQCLFQRKLWQTIIMCLDNRSMLQCFMSASTGWLGI